jgi:kynurenine formamidase
MPTFPGLASPQVCAVWTHAEAEARGYRDTSCEVTEARFVTSIGTYLDAPFHFDPDGADISELRLDQVVLPGALVDARPVALSGGPLPPALLDGLDIMGRAVLFLTGWSVYWGSDRYYSHPFVSRSLAEELRRGGAGLVGIDTLVIDDPGDPSRPAHTCLLRAGVLIVENLRGLDQLAGRPFTFVAAAAKVARAAAFPVRAFAITGPCTGAQADP